MCLMDIKAEDSCVVHAQAVGHNLHTLIGDVEFVLTVARSRQNSHQEGHLNRVLALLDQAKDEMLRAFGRETLTDPGFQTYNQLAAG